MKKGEIKFEGRKGSAEVHRRRVKREKKKGATGREAGQRARRRREERGVGRPPSMR